MARNRERHGDTSDEKAQAVIAQTEREIQQLYEIQHDVCNEDQDLFPQTLEELLSTSQANQYAWKANWGKCILASVKRKRAWLQADA